MQLAAALMPGWGGGEWLAFGVTIVTCSLIVVALWASPRSRTGVGVRLLWSRLRARVRR